MRKSLLSSVCAASLALGMATGAQAADPAKDSGYAPAGTQWYASVFGGATFWDSYDPVVVLGGANYPYSAEFETGYIVGGAIGIDSPWVDNLRHELEISFMWTEADQFTGPFLPFVGVGVSGTTSSLNVLINAWYDFDLGGALQPYVGGGIGVGFVDSRVVATNFLNPGSAWDDSDIGFAFQIGAGVKVDLSQSVALDVGYRYRGVLDVQFPAGPAWAVGTTTGAGDDFGVHAVQAGLTFKLY